MIRFLFALLVGLSSASAFGGEAKPNVLIFYLDDMGWAQPGCYGGKLMPTPNIDALAQGGVRFTNGYVSACVCAPSRVGLMTGRYQARTGHDANTSDRPGSELARGETTMAQRMKALGYATGITGKWHLGSGPEFLPAARGFDFSVGTVGNLGEGRGPAFYRGKELLEELPGAPVTSPVFAREAAGFIEAHKAEPFFLYVPLNGVHAPHVASEAWLQKAAHIEDRRARAYAANLGEADEAIGTVMTKLRELGLEENTLIFCISDNGGAAEEAEMGGLRGRKWLVWEGGIRVSWIAQWQGRIPAGRVVNEPVIQLDVLPTAMAAAGASPPNELDGINLLPLLEGKVEKLQPRVLCWRFGVQHAVRSGDWKLVKASDKMEPMLVNLASDPGEQKDLSVEHPDKKAELQKLFETWNATMQPPRWEDRRWNGEEARKMQKAGKPGKKKKKKERDDA